MQIFDKLLHFLTPRPSNNHRARALHSSSLSIYVVALLVFQIFLTTVGHISPEVLGYASNINVNDLLNNTNAKRAAAGVPPVVLNDQLSAAANNKGADMFANQYWAHVSPQGKDPWSWIIAAGYNYVFAGENLARDYGDSGAVVDAWMNSPTHKENLLNSRFKDVGFAVINGKYGDSETTLVVQEFGSKSSQQATVEAPAATSPAPAPVPPSNVQVTDEAVEQQKNPDETSEASPSSSAATPTPKPTPPSIPTSETGSILSVEPQNSTNKLPFHFDIISITKVVSSVLLIALISVMAVDSYIVYRRKVVRLSGHNYAHMMILLAVLAAINIIGKGTIL